jgi:hypothetical protein
MEAYQKAKFEHKLQEKQFEKWDFASEYIVERLKKSG